MAADIPTPSVWLRAFACPHCGAFAKQYWFDLYGEMLDRADTPHIPTDEDFARWMADPVLKEDEKKARTLRSWFERMTSAQPCTESVSGGRRGHHKMCNLFASRCDACDQVAVWIRDRLAYPPAKAGPEPNSDLPEEILRDYEEARRILELSPRGAAALLRLSIQRLCAHLGETGEDIDADIASLVGKGLDQLVQQALDAVRVIGEEAVRPGVLDLSDDRDTAAELFALMNVIADEMITRPKSLKAVYDRLPQSKRDAIDARNAKALKK